METHYYFNQHPHYGGMVQLHMMAPDYETARLRAREIFKTMLDGKWKDHAELVRKYCFQLTWYDKATIDGYMNWDGG